MFCNKCGYKNKDSSHFCIKCGYKLQITASVNQNTNDALEDGLLLQGRYKILKQIGKGGMGVVYLASDNRFSNRVCVVKEMLEYLANNSDEEKAKALARFNQEADLLAEINYPNVPQVYDRFSEGNRHYLVMEFIEGIDFMGLLEQHLKIYGTPLAEEDIIVCLMQLCLTLKYLHSHVPPILHRDIKPPNILFTKEGKVKLVDFGIAKTVQTKNAGTSIGTQGYAAPEQYKGFADERTDIYALGATMHHLLTGRNPQMETPFDYPPVKKINSKISNGLSDIIELMLFMNVESRVQDMDELIRAIRDVCPEIDKKLVTYSIGDNIQKILESKSEGKSKGKSKSEEVLSQNMCSVCNHENKPTSKFCVKCGTVLGSNSKSIKSDGTLVNNFDTKIIIESNNKFLSKYPDGYSNFIRVPNSNGEVKVNVILEDCMIEGMEYIYITEKSPSIVGQEVIPYAVIRNTQGAMQSIKVIKNEALKFKLYEHWKQFVKS